jgi:hypothetical protein
MREIENGTYRRHVLRAERTLGVSNLLTAAERKRQGLPEIESQSQIPPPKSGSMAPNADEANAKLPTSTRNGSIAPDTNPAGTLAGQVRAEIERNLGLLLDDDLDAFDSKSLRARHAACRCHSRSPA